MRDFELTGRNGDRELLSRYRGTSNLLLLLGDEQWIRLISAEDSSFTQYGVKLLAFPCSSAAAGPVVLQTLAGHGSSAAYLTDRYGEVIYAWRENEGRERPSLKELLGWAEHLERRCDECFPSEWPD